MLTNEDLDRIERAPRGMLVTECANLVVMARECLKLREDVRVWARLFDAPTTRGKRAFGDYHIEGVFSDEDEREKWYVENFRLGDRIGYFATPLDALRAIEKLESDSVTAPAEKGATGTC